MSAWAKIIIAESLDSVFTQGQADHRLLNAACTSQMDSVPVLLKGKTVVDGYYRVTVDLLQAGHNATLNVLTRYEDAEIILFAFYQKLRCILLVRFLAQLSVNKYGSQVLSIYQLCTDKSSVQIYINL